MTPKDLVDYLDSTLDCAALRRLDPPSLHRLENLLHHWYALVGDLRRQKLVAAGHGPTWRPSPINPAPAFRLAHAPRGDEHATHPGI
jgi:hypothetical protein